MGGGRGQGLLQRTGAGRDQGNASNVGDVSGVREREVLLATLVGLRRLIEILIKNITFVFMKENVVSIGLTTHYLSRSTDWSAK